MTALGPHLVAVLLCASALGIAAVSALDNGLARTPPMGWLAWERFVCETDCQRYPDDCISQRLFESMAERLAEDGFADLGYTYVNIDDCWSTRRRDDKTHALVPDPDRFPDMWALADKVHRLGLKLGIYGDCGTATCQNFPGQLRTPESLAGNFFQLDAQTFADWQIDSFKFDGCNLATRRAGQLCPPMGLALNQTGRPMLFSCSWPAYENDEKLPTDWELVKRDCNLWRAFGDIEDSWLSVLGTVDDFVEKQEIAVKYHGPGGWFDADQLVIGNFGLSLDQQRAQMAIWCVWASPLYISNDLRRLEPESAAILLNRHLIAVNQDPMGIFGLMVSQTERKELQAFLKPIEPIVGSCPSYALVYLNRRTLGTSRLSGFRLSEMLSSLHEKLAKVDKWRHWKGCAQLPSYASFSVFDLFDNSSKIDQLSHSDKLELLVNPSGVRMVKLVRDDSLSRNQVEASGVNNPGQPLYASAAPASGDDIASLRHHPRKPSQRPSSVELVSPEKRALFGSLKRSRNFWGPLSSTLGRASHNKRQKLKTIIILNQNS